MRKHWKRTLSLLAVAAAVALVSAGLALGKKPPKDPPPPPPPPPELPSVRYRINFPVMPVGADGQVVNHMNNLGQVVGWYYNDDTGFKSAFVYNSITDQADDINSVVTAGIPDGWHFASVTSINDWMVAVGYLEQIGSGQRQRVAVDLVTENPVVDLLPSISSELSGMLRINNNGDIVGLRKTESGVKAFWTFNPGFYGDPLLREVCDGTPLDMSGVTPQFLPITHTLNLQRFHLNNPVGSRPAQIAGTNGRHEGFRYTLGDAAPEVFPELDIGSDVHGFNDEGTLCGRT